jgi:predicted nucleic acid-binding protein
VSFDAPETLKMTDERVMKSRVYLETTIPSYLTARPSRDIVRAAEQEVTRTWWNSRNIFELYVSELVVDEVAAGDPHAASQRLEALAGIQLLGMTREAEMLGADLIRQAALPQRAAIDALHIALAAVHGMNYLLTWNCKHIANATMRGKIEEVCRATGVEPPIICTPMELLEE